MGGVEGVAAVDELLATDDASEGLRVHVA